MGVVVERTGDDHVEPRIARLAGGANQVLATYGPEFRLIRESITLAANVRKSNGYSIF